MTETPAPVVWQRVPQGWIELVAFADDDVAAAWWRAYLAPAAALGATSGLDAATLRTLTDGFAAARDALRESPYAVAGLFPYLVDEPTVFFIGTVILPSPESPQPARAASSLAGLVRFADGLRTESFLTLDGRTGAASLGLATTPEGVEIAAITGEVALPHGDGTVFTLALSLDPGRLDELVPYAALALDSTQLLADDATPAPYPPAEWLAAENAPSAS